MSLQRQSNNTALQSEQTVLICERARNFSEKERGCIVRQTGRHVVWQAVGFIRYDHYTES
jgi:hypothetical protein